MVCVLFPVAVASAFEFERVDVEGLSHNSVYAILQDRQGFLWLGTADGLNRFDGREVVVFRNDPDDASSLTGNVVSVLIEDRQGTLWIGTSGGVSRLEPAREGFVQAVTCTGEPMRNVTTLIEDQIGTLWAGSPAGLWRFGVVGGCWTRTPVLTDHGVGVIREGPDGLLVLGSDKAGVQSAHLFDPVSMALDEIPLPDDTATSYSFLYAASGELWLDASGPAVLVEKERRVELDSPPPADVEAWSFVEDEDGVVWVGTNLGLRRWDPETRQLEQFLIVPSQGAWLQNHIRALFFDRDGALWVGTHGGLYRHDPFRKVFVSLTSDPTNPNSLSGNAVSALCEDPAGAIWVGTFGAGVNRLDPETRLLRHYHHPKARDEPMADVVWSVLAGDDGRIWVADTLGLSSLDPDTGVYTAHPEAYPFDRPLRTLVRGESGELWIGGLGGLCRYEPTLMHAECFKTSAEENDLVSGAVESLLLDGNGGLWIGGRSLVRLDMKSGEFSTHQLTGDTGRVVGGEGLWAMHRSQSGTLWLGSGSGLSRFDPSNEDFRHYSTGDGLPGSVVYSILEDARGRLWLGTNNGLALFDPSATEGREFRAFDSSDGVLNSEFNRRAALETRDGEYFFGGLDGLTLFDPVQLRDNPRPPQVVIEGITVWSREGSIRVNPQSVDQLVLSHKDTIVSFDFVALSYTNPQKNRYAYRLEGFDERWVDAGSRGSARYTTMAPGRYFFRVKASNSDGVWNEEGASFPVIVVPPFWQTWWFRAFVVLLIAAAAVGLHRVRIKRLLELERVRLQIASDLHDDLSSNLAGVALETDMLRQSPHLPEEHQDRLGELRDTTLDMVASLRDIVWIINPEHDTLESLESRMRRTAKSLAGGREVRFDARLPDALELDMGLRRNLFLIFKEAVHNAVRHAGADILTIRLEEAESVLRLEVRDDGSGFCEDQIIAGHGLRSMRWRAQQMGATLTITPGPESGTEVVLEIKLA